MSITLRVKELKYREGENKKRKGSFLEHNSPFVFMIPLRNSHLKFIESLSHLIVNVFVLTLFVSVKLSVRLAWTKLYRM